MKNSDLTAVILSGGLGTRLRSVVSDVPKVLAPVAGRPFLYWLLKLLRIKGVSKAILLLGYRAKMVIDYCGDGSRWGLKIDYSIEETPLDKAGALRLALPKIDEEDFLFLNGDTILDVDVSKLLGVRRSRNADLVIALRPWKSIDRTDPVVLKDDDRVLSFGDKSVPSDKDGNWLVNGGVYAVSRSVVEKIPQGRYSWEHKVIPDLLDGGGPLYGMCTNGYFIDIGVPEDFKRAQRDIPEFMGHNVDKS